MSRVVFVWIVLCACGGEPPREPSSSASEAHSGAEPTDVASDTHEAEDDVPDLGLGPDFLAESAGSAADFFAESAGSAADFFAESAGSAADFFVHDIQGLYGGWAMYVHGERVTVVEVDPRASEPERRWERGVDAAWLETARAAVASALSVEVPERPGVPDEARTVIVATDARGSVLRNAAWEGQRDPTLGAFWAPVGELRRLARELANGEPSFVGPADHAWRPPGVAWPSL